MNCPACGTENTRVVDTFKGFAEKRKRRCLCGVTFETTETVVSNSIRTPLVGTSQNQSEPVPIGRNPSQPVSTERDSTQIPSFPDPIRSGSPPGPLSDLRLDLFQQVDRAKEYDPRFLAFWDEIEPIARRKGDKAEAQKVWMKKGRPNSTELVAGWIRYRASCGDGYTMDADKWLRHDGWKKDWEPAPARVPASRTAGNIDTLRNYEFGKGQTG